METKIVSFCHGKGGSGKSTLTNMVASYLKSIGLKIYVADIDTGQGSLIDLRQMDLNDNVDNSVMYDLVAMDPIDFPKTYENELEGEYDYVFLDFPGTLMQPGVISCLTTIDYMFVPTGFDINDLTAFRRFVSLYNEQIAPLRSQAGLETVFKGVWNRVFTNVAEYKERKATEGTLGVVFLDNVVPNSFVTFGRNAKTHGKMEYNTGKDYIEEFLKEVSNLLGVKQLAI